MKTNLHIKTQIEIVVNIPIIELKEPNKKKETDKFFVNYFCFTKKK